MKKIVILIVSVMMLSFVGCSKSEDVQEPTVVNANTKQNWLITITSVISASPSLIGFPYSTVTPVEKDGLTADEAEAAIKELCVTTSRSSNGYTYTTTKTGTKRVR